MAREAFILRDNEIALIALSHANPSIKPEIRLAFITNLGPLARKAELRTLRACGDASDGVVKEMIGAVQQAYCFDVGGCQKQVEARKRAGRAIIRGLKAIRTEEIA